MTELTQEDREYTEAQNEFSRTALEDIEDPDLKAKAKKSLDVEFDQKVLRMRVALGVAATRKQT